MRLLFSRSKTLKRNKRLDADKAASLGQRVVQVFKS